MSTKRKWDEPGEGGEAPKAAEKDKSASDAAAAAAAIAAKIAAQFANGQLGLKDEGEFSTEIDINDARNRYMLTKGSTQQEVACKASIQHLKLSSDSRGNGSLSQYKGCLVSRQKQGH